MSPEHVVWVAVAAGLMALAFFMWKGRGARVERASRPRGLANARLVYMETLFRIRHPIRLAAKLDRAYRQPDNSLVLVELKTRRFDTVYPTDVIQLSAQKLAIEVQTGQTVAPFAYVTIEHAGSRRAMRSHRVRLLDGAEVVSLAHRREAILSGRTEPRFAASTTACEGCAYRRECGRPRSLD